MRVPTQEIEAKKLSEKIAQQFTGATNTSETNKMDEFKRSIANIQQMVKQNGDSSSPSVQSLNQRLQAMSNLANGIEDVYFQGGNSEASYQKMVDAYNTLTQESGGSSLRDDVNQFISDNQYKLLETKEFKALMGMVNTAESLEFESSYLNRDSQISEANKLNEKDLQQSQLSENDPDIIAFNNLIKNNPDIDSFDKLSYVSTHAEERLNDKRAAIVENNLTTQREINMQMYAEAQSERDELAPMIAAGKKEYEQYQQYDQAYNALKAESSQLKEKEELLTSIEDQIKRHTTIIENQKIVEEVSYSQSIDIQRAQQSQSFMNINTKDVMNGYLKSVQDAHKARQAGDEKAERAAMQKQSELYAKALKEDREYTNDFLRQIKDQEDKIVQANNTIKDNDMVIGRSTLSKTNAIGMAGVKSLGNRTKKELDGKLKEYKQKLNYPGNGSIDDLLKHGENMVKSSKTLVENSPNVNAYQTKQGRLNELNETISRRAPNIKQVDLINQSLQAYNEAEASLKNVQQIKDNLDAKMKSINSGIENAQERTSKTVSALKGEENPQVQKTINAVASIAGHIEDMTSKGHSNSEEFERLKTTLNNFSRDYKKGDMASCKDLMFEVKLRAEQYFNAKTKDGKNLNRVTTMGKVRLNHTMELMNTIKQMENSEPLWEKQNEKVNNLEKTEFKKITKNDFEKSVNQKIQKPKTKSVEKQKTKTEQKTNEKKAGGYSL